MRGWLPLAVALAGPAGAGEDCPTREDLARGIEVAYDDGLRLIVRSTDRAGVLATETPLPDGMVAHSEQFRGAYPLWLEIEGTEGEILGRTEFVLVSTTPGQPAPNPGGRIRYTARLDGPFGGGALLTETRDFGPIEEVVVAGCAYRALGSQAEQDTGSIDRTGSWFLLDLGFSVNAWVEPAGSPRQPREVVTFRAVE